MTPYGFRPLDRGEISILAAFSLVVVLAGVGLFFQSFSGPHPLTQTAASGSADGTDANTGVQQECKAGFVNKIGINKGSFPNIKDEPVDCYAGQTEAQKKQNVPAQNPLCKDLGANQCRVVACVPQSMLKAGKNQCSVVGTCDTTDPTDCKNMMNKVQTGKATDIFSVMQTKNGDFPGFTQLLNQNVNGGNDIMAAFKDPLSQTKQQVQNQIADYDAAIKGVQDVIDKCGGDTRDPSCANLAEFQRQQEQLKKEQATLQSQLKDLTDAQKTLSPECPTGQTGTPPNCTPVVLCSGANCGPGGTPTPNPGNQNTFSKSGLSNLLGGLTRGLGTQAPPTTQPPAQACSTDSNAYAQQQQQYQQQLQQYNYQLQQYQYQQQYNYGSYGASASAPLPPSACTPSTQNQCGLQPQQPNSSSCTGGTWRPQYSGNCIMNWQCSNLGAELSCAPRVADVGMTLAIAYSCAEGTASGSGFTASGSSGTTTATVAELPQGTNTATYALTCTQGAQTSGAQCSIQVARPSIILVANPGTIARGATSLLGWLTVGMKNCRISSTDDPAFTAQNLSNTSVNGTATTLASSNTKGYLLHCETLAGGVKDATISVVAQ